MLTINKTCVVLPANNMQNNQKHDSIKLKTLNHDTVSFNGWFSTPRTNDVSDAVMEAVKKAEAENPKVVFFKTLGKLCKDFGDDIARKADADAQMLYGDNALKAHNLLNLIISDPDPKTEKFIIDEAKSLKERVGLNPVR
jgi:hypothetical protein